MKKTHIKLGLSLLTLAFLSACSNDPKEPGYVYMPDMGYSQAYETYTSNPNFADSMTARKPVEGTIARGTLPADFSDENALTSYQYKKYYNESVEDYEKAGRELKNPVALTDDVLKEGKAIYTIYCRVCHGDKGDGKGPIVESGAFPAVPAYKDILPNINEGKMFHSITYGKNLMGSHSSQVNTEERWKVIYYIQKLAGVGSFSSSATVSADTTTTAN